MLRKDFMKEFDVVIVGAGVAGLNCALHLPRDKKILIICKGKPEKCDSYLAMQVYTKTLHLSSHL